MYVLCGCVCRSNVVGWSGISGNTLALINSMRRSKRSKMTSNNLPAVCTIIIIIHSRVVCTCVCVEATIWPSLYN